MTAPTPKAPKQKRKDCLNVTIKVQIPFSDRASLEAAYAASDDAKDYAHWPAGSAVTVSASTGKM